MTRWKLRVHNTDTDNLLSNLRGEVGEIITSWILYKDLMLVIHRKGTSDPVENMKRPALNRLSVLTERLVDDIVARLSELAERKIGRLNFHFASVKLNALEDQTAAFAKYVRDNRFEEKRNAAISHKEIPERWSDHRSFYIRPRVILKGIAHALRLMKKFDCLHLGPSGKYLWYEARKKRYEPMIIPSVGYLLVPHLRLPKEIRIKVALEEVEKGLSCWEDMSTEIDGKKAIVKANKKWGVVRLEDAYLVTREYPLIELKSIAYRESDEA